MKPPFSPFQNTANVATTRNAEAPAIVQGEERPAEASTTVAAAVDRLDFVRFFMSASPVFPATEAQFRVYVGNGPNTIENDS